MKSIDKGDHDFERALLHSASRDAPDADAGERAWMRFTTLTASIAGADAASPGMPAAPQTRESIGRFARVMTAAKWVMVGALGGSAVTFALIAHRVPGHPLASAPLVPSAQTVVAVAAPSPVATRPILETEPSAAIVAPHPSASGPTALSALHSSARASGLGLVSLTEEASSLAAEVAALDAARSALDTGAQDDALALLGRYLREFPKGKLVPEAEVMAIEARAAKGERARVIRDATRFLDRHPNAPQRTRVEQLRSQTAQE